MMGIWGARGFGFGHPGLRLVIMLLNLAFGVALLVGLVLLAVWLARIVSHGAATTTAGTGRPASPSELARLRYARGEISREQYLQLLADLGGPAG